jgi:hypothetical protein
MSGLIALLLFACNGKDGDLPSPPADDTGASGDDGGSGGDDTGEGPDPDEPWVEGLRVEPEEPRTTDDLDCVWDDLRNASSITIEWYKNNYRIEDQGGTSLSSDFTRKQDEIRCEVTPEGGDTFVSEPTRILNSSPEVLSVTILPEDATSLDSVVIADVEYTDPDNDPPRLYDYHYIWFVNGEETAYDEPALGRAYWEKGDEIEVVAWMRDSSSSNTLRSDPVIIGNAPPSEPVVEFSGGEGSDLSCAVVKESVDVDEEEVTYEQAWRRFGVPVDLDLSCDSEGLMCSLAAIDVEPGASFTCEVTPSDGEDEGDPASVTIDVGGDVLRYQWIGEDAAAKFGSVLLRAPDLDGDGSDDLLVGAPKANAEVSSAGVVLLLGSAAFGEDSSVEDEGVAFVLGGEENDSYFGSVMTWMPDIDGDGDPELVVGAPFLDSPSDTDAGAAYVYFSSTFEDDFVESDYSVVYFGKAQQEWAGSGVAATDLNGDDLPELLVGAPGRKDGKDVAGGVYIFPGTRVLEEGELEPIAEYGVATLNGADLGEGSAISVDSDFDGDGLKDLLVQVPDSGSVYLLLGDSLTPSFSDDPDGMGLLLQMADSVAATLTASASTDELGASMAGVVLSDGAEGILLGAPGANDGAGVAYLWALANGSLSAAASFEGFDAQEMGTSVATLGALDSGGDWVILGAPGDDSTFSGAGGAVVVHSADWQAAATYAADTSSDDWFMVYGEEAYVDFGTAVAGVGDFDGSGGLDLAAGTPRKDRDSFGFDVGGVTIWLDIF